MDDSSSSIIKDLGRSYIVSSLLPAALFLSLGGLAFRGFAPGFLATRLIAQDQFYTSQWFIFLTFTVWVAYGLFSITDWTVRLYEGYFFPKKVKTFLVYFIKQWYERLTPNIRDFKKLRAEGHSPDSFDYKKYSRAAKIEYFNLERIAPFDEKNLLPTRFGNILLACEQYSEEKYKMDGFALWTRLLQVLPKQLIDQIEEKNNQMIFLLNSSLLAYFNGCLALIVGSIRLPCQIWSGWSVCHTGALPQNFFERGFEHLSPTEFLLVGLAFIVGGYVIYRLALPVTEAVGLLMRSGFDLYRFDMLRQLNIEVPPSLEEELNKWEIISEYFNAGNRLSRDPDRPYKIEYFVREELAKGVNLVERARKKRTVSKKPKSRKKN